MLQIEGLGRKAGLPKAKTPAVMLAFRSWARYYPRMTIRRELLFVKEKVEESGAGRQQSQNPQPKHRRLRHPAASSPRGGSPGTPQVSEHPERKQNQKGYKGHFRATKTVSDDPGRMGNQHGRRLRAVVRRPTKSIHGIHCNRKFGVRCRRAYRDGQQ